MSRSTASARSFLEPGKSSARTRNNLPPDTRTYHPRPSRHLVFLECGGSTPLSLFSFLVWELSVQKTNQLKRCRATALQILAIVSAGAANGVASRTIGASSQID